VQGNIYGAHTGDTKGAVESYRNALRISQALARANGNDLPARLYLARSYKSLGQMLPMLGQPSEGLADLRKACELLEGLSAADPGNESLRAELANSYQTRGDLEGHSGLQNLGDRAAALASYRKGLDIYKDQAARKPDSQSARRGLAVLRIRIADLELAGGDSKKSLHEYREALAALEEMSAADPANAESRLLAATGYRKVGGALEEAGQLKGALENYAKAAALNESLTKADPGNAQAAMGLAISLRFIGDLLSKKGDQAGALANYRRVLGILEKLSEAQPANVLVGGRRAEMLIFAAAALARNGKLEEARKTAASGLAITRKLAIRADATRDELSEYAGNFLNCIPADLREPATAVEYARRAVEKTGGRDKDALELLAEAYFQNADSARAIESGEKALNLLPAGGDPETRRTIEAQLARFKAALRKR
jgi:tetratricopeptide (TPR) repeat protein